jgi:hypothetical protein
MEHRPVVPGLAPAFGLPGQDIGGQPPHLLSTRPEAALRVLHPGH